MKMDYETAMTWSVFALKRQQMINKATEEAVAEARAKAERDRDYEG